MKKTFVFLIAVIMLLAIPVEAFAEMPDFASMTDEELHEIIGLARNELKKRELNFEEKMILFEQDGVTVYFTGEYEVYGSDSKFIKLFVTAVNDSDRDVNVQEDAFVINGWDVYGSGIHGITAHHKKKDEFTFNLSDADITTYEEIEEILFDLYLYDGTDWERISDIEPITVHFN